MSFVSYAQNFEDVMLWRALKHVQNGVYVDVGAQHPVVDSVSKAFYELGWRGIHIEPVLEYAELLRNDRPDETVLQVALAETEGTLELNVIPDTGLSTAVDAYAQRHQVERGFGHQRIQVPVLTLKSALKSLVGKDVHWLKIDVEGFEEKVLKGWDSQILRPWVMVVEATIPNSPETDYASWDPILTAANYQFVYFDGLNRFYIAKEHAELAEAFSCPPNVFDGVQLSGLASSELCRGLIAANQTIVEALTQRTVQLGGELQTAMAHENRLQAHAEWLQSEWDAGKDRVEALSQRTNGLESELASERLRTNGLESELASERLRTNGLESELASERLRTVQLGGELQTAMAHENRLQAHAEWLQSEWDAAKTRVDELSHSSHHWWSVADGLNRELQGVYASKSWRITWPLRQAMRAAKSVVVLPARALRWALRLPKRMAKPLVAWAMSKILAKPDLTAIALSVLAKHPRLKQHLRQLVHRSGFIVSWDMASRTSHPSATGSDSQNIVATASIPKMPEESIRNLSSRVVRIYTDLQKAIEARKSGCVS